MFQVIDQNCYKTMAELKIVYYLCNIILLEFAQFLCYWDLQMDR